MPRLSDRAQEHLRRVETPEVVSSSDQPDASQYITTSWGSPYPPAARQHGRRQSSDSERSDDSPIHQLEINTPYLRAAPVVSPTNQEQPTSSRLSDSVAVLLNRVRRPLRGITEGWIRAHTTNDLTSENRHWLSDGDYSEHSSLSSSNSGDEGAWFEEADQRTPRPPPRGLQVPHQRQVSQRRLRERASDDTLKAPKAMDGADQDAGRDAQDVPTIQTNDAIVADRSQTPPSERKPSMNGPAQPPVTPTRPSKSVPSQTPRLRKKVPWNGKNIMIHLPRDEERGQPGKRPMPLSAHEITEMYREWDELGYDTRGFDLDGSVGYSSASLDPLESYCQSRNLWPNLEDIANDRAQRHYQVTLPDLNAWKDYVNELNEAKLRALGVSFGDDEPPQSAVSPALSNQYPPLPFSPPLPTGSVASNGPQGFPFPGAFHGTSATQSPTVPTVASPASFNGMPGKFNPRASISISPHELPFHFSGQPSPHGWSPTSMLLHQHLGRSGSPSVMNMNSLVSPTSSPFPPEGLPSPIGVHQRHQSLQYPMLPHQQLQRQDSARASPRLQELREVDEETQSNPYENRSPSKTPEPGHFVRHNASASLQREIDDAEYHLEEQFREQLEHEDYSPHQAVEKTEADQPEDHTLLHARGPSVHFGNFGNDSDEGPVLHHPRPHSRGHSLTQKPFFDPDEVRDSADEASVNKLQTVTEHKGDESFEVETNPSNMGTPASAFDFVNKIHDRSISTASNPWADMQSLNEEMPTSRRTSHASKASFSKLNAGASEFKFNPNNTFVPSGASGFNFGSTTFQPNVATFQPGAFQSSFSSNPPQSATSSHFSAPSVASSKGKINVSAPVFSPGQSEFSFPVKSDFSFSASGPKFNPDAPTFQPLTSFAASVTSAAASGNESVDRRSSIFSGFELGLSDVVKPAKKSKAIPIIRPASRESPASAPVEEVDQDGRITDSSRRSKKFRATSGDEDEVPRFAEVTPEPEPLMATQGKTLPKQEPKPEEAPEEEEEENGTIGDTTLASTVMSESTDGKFQSEFQSESNGTKATTSPASSTPDQDKVNWAPFEFRNETEVHDFNNARPFGDMEPSLHSQKSSLSGSVKPFAPVEAFTFGGPNPMAASFEPAFKTQPPPMTSPDESDIDRTGSPTPGPEPHPAKHLAEPASAAREPTPEPVHAPKSGLSASRFAPPPPRQGLGASRFASPPPPVPQGLTASRFAKSPSPVSDREAARVPEADIVSPDLPHLESFPVSPPSVASEEEAEEAEPELTFEEIDAVMKHLNENDPNMGMHRTIDTPKWRRGSPTRNIPITAVVESSPLHLPPQDRLRSDAPSPSPRQHKMLPPGTVSARMSRELDDPFLEPPRSVVSASYTSEGPVHRLGGGIHTESEEWDKAFSADEQDKLEQRAHYFDGHVQDLVGRLLANQLDPLEKTLGSIQDALLSVTQQRRTPSSRREPRSISAEVRESDADDEDDEVPATRLSASPQRNRRMEQIRFAVMEALNQHHASRALQNAVEQSEPATVDSGTVDTLLKELQAVKEHISQQQPPTINNEELLLELQAMKEHLGQQQPPTINDAVLQELQAVKEHLGQQPPISVNEVLQELQAMKEHLSQQQQQPPALGEVVLKELQDMREHFSQSMRVDFPTDDIRNVVEEAVQSKMPPPPPPVVKDDDEATQQMADMQAKIHDLEKRLKEQEAKAESETAFRRELEVRSAELQQSLAQRITEQEARADSEAAFRREVEERSGKLQQHLENRLKEQESNVDIETAFRREVEEHSAEVQRALEKRLREQQDRVEKETSLRRQIEDRSADLQRALGQAETRVEVEIMNRSLYDQRVQDLEERLRHQEQKAESELGGRRDAEDRLSEIQRLLRISSEEEDRLRAVLEDREQKIKGLEQVHGKSAMRLALLEAAQHNADKTQIDLTNRLNASEEELRGTKQEARHWRSEAEHARDAARRQTDDLISSIDEAKHLRKVIDTLNTTLGETEKVRETWRAKFVSMQDDMARAAREISEENARRSKREQALIARQEVLDARLQAESKTRERLEAELERLEGGERAGLRAVADCKRLESLLADVRSENHKIQTAAMHFQREAREAKENAAEEIERARDAIQAELRAAGEQVNVVRIQHADEIEKVRAELVQAYSVVENIKQEHAVMLEEEANKFRAQIDQVRLDADTAKAHHDMMLEEAQNTRTVDVDELVRKHQNEIEDLQTRFERELSNKSEDAQRAETALLERLSLSTSKTNHLQDRVAHLEERLEIAQEAAKAAAQAAKAAGVPESAALPVVAARPAAVSQAMQLPEKISPQALRESIMVLQEQLQAREQNIEELEQTISTLDPDAPTKISKRDDEITWLRELLAVRHGDLQDIIAALSSEGFNREAVKDAAIRLKANLQMEEQERERAMNGGSAISLPDIAAAIRGAATPRVAQAVGPLAAAWGNWRKANQPALNNLSTRLSSPAVLTKDQTPSRSNPSPASQSSFLSGLMTPPASSLRNTPPGGHDLLQPTAFGNTGRRYTPEQFANRNRGPSITSRQLEKMPMLPGTPPRASSSQRVPMTPPMAPVHGYDDDASNIEDFDDTGFFDD